MAWIWALNPLELIWIKDTKAKSILFLLMLFKKYEHLEDIMG